jgi:hypothetical protein
VKSAGTGQSASATTDQNGAFLVVNLRVGYYDVTVQAAGFKFSMAVLKAGVIGDQFNGFNPGWVEQSVSINGGRKNGNEVTVDGVNNERNVQVAVKFIF